MPHCVLEYSSKIELKAGHRSFFKELHEFMVGTGYFEERSIKSRIRPVEQVYLGNGDSEQSFVFLQISLLSGRPNDLLSTVSSKALELLNKHLELDHSKGYTSVTVEIREMDSSLHSKLE